MSPTQNEIFATEVSNAMEGFFSAGQEAYAAACDMRRPFIVLKPRVFIDGNRWCALYGDNLQDGVAGFGESPELASHDFDAEWLKRLPKVGRGAA